MNCARIGLCVWITCSRWKCGKENEGNFNPSFRPCTVLRCISYRAHDDDDKTSRIRKQDLFSSILIVFSMAQHSYMISLFKCEYISFSISTFTSFYLPIDGFFASHSHQQQFSFTTLDSYSHSIYFNCQKMRNQASKKKRLKKK